MKQAVRVEVEDAVAEVVLDRPPVNALSTGLYEEILEVFTTLDERDDVSVILLRSGCERAFCAGADVRELETIVNSGDPALDERRQALARRVYDAVRGVAQPTIAVIGGAAIGGGAVLAACCDIRYAGSGARIGLTEINVARCGGGRHLMRLLPQGALREMYFTGEPLAAAEALRLGLVDKLVDGDPLAAARDLAARIAAKSPVALRFAKRALNESEFLPLDEGYAVEQGYTLRLGRTDDAVEAARAFLEKRRPVWSGH